MIKNRKEWNELFKTLKLSILKPNDQIKELVLSLHAYVHESNESEKGNSLEDQLWQTEGDFISYSEMNPYSVAWHMWHSARIEDICTAHFMADGEEVFYKGDHFKKMLSPFKHTGNSMNLLEMKEFNETIDLQALRTYRKSLGARTRKVILEMDLDRFQKKVDQNSLSPILDNGSVAEIDSVLLDYWGHKTIWGIVTMPLTKHLLVHLNSSFIPRQGASDNFYGV